jgi:hypothetical protein
MILFAERIDALSAAGRLGALGVLLSSAEFLAEPGYLTDSGLMSWKVGRLRDRWLAAPPFGPALNAVLSYPQVLGVVALRGALAAALLAGPASFCLEPWIVVSMALASVLLSARNLMGQDGADQMQVIIFVTLALVSVARTQAAMTAGLWFIAFQGCLSYATAGIAKLTEAGWRDGSFLTRVLGTQIYGDTASSEFLAARPELAKWLSRALVAWESSFALALALPASAVLALLGGGVVFHCLSAKLMGLNTFLPSFIATYPAIIYCVSSRPW